MKKTIELGAISICNFDPKNGKMFSWDFYYDEDDDEFYTNRVKECNPKEVVLSADTEYTLIIDYPVFKPYKATIKTGKRGMTRVKLASEICTHYKKMYREEDKSAGGHPGRIKGMVNRALSNGTYGIWGHDLGDLVLCNVKIDDKNNITLGVDS